MLTVKNGKFVPYIEPATPSGAKKNSVYRALLRPYPPVRTFTIWSFSNVTKRRKELGPKS